MSNHQPKILITGASGKFGRLVLNELLNSLGYPSDRIIATTRNPENLAEWSERGVEVRKADFADPTSLVSAFEGAERLLLISTDSPVNEVRLGQQTAALAAAKQAGVSHIIYTSMPEAETSLVSFAKSHSGTEHAIKESGLTWTILRNNWYFENLMLSLGGALASGTWYTAAGEGEIAYLSRRDLAFAAATALVGTAELTNVTLTLTGESTLTVRFIAAQVSEALGKSISVVDVPGEAIAEGAKSHGLPSVVADMLASIDVATKAGNLAAVTSDFQDLTGRKPTPFADWFTENKQAFLSTN